MLLLYANQPIAPFVFPLHLPGERVRRVHLRRRATQPNQHVGQGMRNGLGEMVYSLPAELGIPTAKSPLRQLVLDVVHNNVMVVIRTSPGAAQLIARLLDSLSKKDGVLGTIAGDDTIFIAPADVSQIEKLRQYVENLFDNV